MRPPGARCKVPPIGRILSGNRILPNKALPSKDLPPSARGPPTSNPSSPPLGQEEASSSPTSRPFPTNRISQARRRPRPKSRRPSVGRDLRANGAALPAPRRRLPRARCLLPSEPPRAVARKRGRGGSGRLRDTRSLHLRGARELGGEEEASLTRTTTARVERSVFRSVIWLAGLWLRYARPAGGSCRKPCSSTLASGAQSAQVALRVPRALRRELPPRDHSDSVGRRLQGPRTPPPTELQEVRAPGRGRAGLALAFALVGAAPRATDQTDELDLLPRTPRCTSRPRMLRPSDGRRRSGRSTLGRPTSCCRIS